MDLFPEGSEYKICSVCFWSQWADRTGLKKKPRVFLNSCQGTEVPPTGLVHLVLRPGSFIIFSVCLLCPTHPWLQFQFLSDNMLTTLLPST